MTSSVIITTYNAEGVISKVLQALVEHLDPDDEVVVVDDGSTDSTTSLVRSFDDPRIKLVAGGRIGRSKALNLALDNSKGDLIFINDADDVPFPNRFRLARHYHEQGYDIVFGQAITVESVATAPISELVHAHRNSPPSDTSTADAGRELSSNMLYRSNPLHHSTMSISREQLFRIGKYDESLRVCIDLELYMRALENNLKSIITPHYFTIRSTGAIRTFAQFPRRTYLSTLIKLRSIYRRKLKPSTMTYIYDVKLHLIRFFSLVARRG